MCVFPTYTATIGQKKYCIRTVKLSCTNVQQKNYKPVTQRNLNVKLTLNKIKRKNWFVGMGNKDIDWMFSPYRPQSVTIGM